MNLVDAICQVEYPGIFYLYQRVVGTIWATERASAAEIFVSWMADGTWARRWSLVVAVTDKILQHALSWASGSTIVVLGAAMIGRWIFPTSYY